LSGVAKSRSHCAKHCFIEVGVVIDDNRILAAELGNDFLDSALAWARL
jgi:hypothetical protein